MSRAAPVAALVPPLPQRTALPSTSVVDVRATERPAPAAAPFDLTRLRLLPRPQRGAVADSEETSVKPQLTAGPAEDEFEREADEVAETVMRMPRGAVETGEDGPGLRRMCADCEAEDTVQRKSVAEAEAETGPPALSASPGELTSGGTPLSHELQSFYEQRLGRDLSAVRLHQGAPAQAMNDSISARAFTYGSHVWLARDESAAPSNTLSHELAHVLQQTQPRAIQEDAAQASAAAPAAQRYARWVPTSCPDLTKTRAAPHDAVIKEVSKDPKNADLLAEVPIPNAGRANPSGGSFGLADFLKASPQAIPGVWVLGGAGAEGEPEAGEDEEAVAPPEGLGDVGAEEPPPDAPDAPAEPGVPSPPDRRIENFDDVDWKPHWLADWKLKNPTKLASLAQPMKGGVAFPVAGHQHPRVADDKLVGVPRAPKEIALGELKPGHNVEAGVTAFTKQLPRYRRGLTKVRDAVNAVDPTRRDGTWTINFHEINSHGSGMTGLVIPAGLHPKTKKPTFSCTLDLQVNGKSLPSPTTVSGHLALGPHADAGFRGVWSYAFIPSNAPRAQTLTKGQRAGIKRLEKQLRDIIAKLKKTPTRARRRRRDEKPRLHEARPARRMVRRAPKVRADEFNRTTWEAERDSLAKAFRGWKATEPTAAATIEQQGALREAFRRVADELKGASVPPMSGQALADIKLLHRLERVTDSKFGPLLGVLREKFGTVFVKLANAYDSFRTRLAERTRRAPTSPPSAFSGWKKKALRLLITAAATGARLLMQQVVANFAACLDGLADKLLARFEGELAETFEEEIEQLTAAFDEVRARIETELQPFLAELDALYQTLEDVEQLTRIIGDIVTAARIAIQAASCLTPPLKGCLWGLVAQIGIEGVLAIAVDQQWFKEAVINPIARKLITPIADKTYTMLLETLLGEPDAVTVRGRLSTLVGETAQCRVPRRAQLFSWSGSGGLLPTRDPKNPGADARRTAEEWQKRYEGEIDRAIKDRLRNEDGTPASDEQIADLLDAIEKSGLDVDELESAFDRARKGGKTDPEAAREAVAEDAAAAEAEPAVAPPDAKEEGESKAPGIDDLRRADTGVSSGGTPVELWYAVLQTPASDRKPKAPVVVDLYFPRSGRSTLRYSGLRVTFVDTYSEAESEGGAEVPWLRFALDNAVHLEFGGKNGTLITLGAREWDVRLAGETP